MTVGGVTRFGYGTTDNPRDPDFPKKLVSDAIRNAAMRFGVALDLWSEEDLVGGDEPASTAAPAAHEPAAQTGRDWIAEFNACKQRRRVCRRRPGGDAAASARTHPRPCGPQRVRRVGAALKTDRKRVRCH